ncbi:MAG: substrate-binding domain-containing protein [Rubrobacter sp.]|jgi:DNA-binding LacI/PurR family transcriptional regulator|nr:substrate-binding domain-containing protein [Rubrobacter sp.]MBA3950914.1 substrate-binding domain-containing protein [Rubrobacter sp.]MDQ3360370.1 substrate-binding domain-containing protein [Actinomycetota bacterium]
MGVNSEEGKVGRRATLKEVAAEVGVSPATVSNAYNRPDQLSEGLRKKVMEAARRLGYTGPNPTARGLRRGRAGAIGVLYADRLSYAFADPAAVLFFEGVSRAAEEAGFGLLLVPGSISGRHDPQAVRGAAVDGFVVYCMAEGDRMMGVVHDRRLPAVLVDDPPKDLAGGMPNVSIDDEGGARAAAEHLVGLGHRRIAVVTFELAPQPVGGLADLARQAQTAFRSTRLRLDGYREAVESAGVPWESMPVYECPENLPGEGEKAAKILLGMRPRPTAILATSDQIAFGVLEAARGMGLSVPGDLSVVGYDDVPEAARANPPLTTVNQPHVEKGLLAGRLLVARLGGEEVKSPGPLPTYLVVRGSTAPPRL